MSRLGIDRALVVLLLLSACAVGPKAKTVGPAAPSKHDIYSSLQLRQAAIRSLRGQGAMRAGSGWARHLNQVAMAIRRPLDFRLDNLSEFGFYNYQMAARAGQLTVLWHKGNRYFRGVGSEEDFSRSLKVPLTTEEMINLLLTAVCREGEEDYRLRIARDQIWLKGAREEIWLQREGDQYLPFRVKVLNLDGSAAYQIFYDDYRSVNDILFPYRIRGNFRRSKIDLKLDEVELNPSLTGDLFEVEVPDDAIRIY